MRQDPTSSPLEAEGEAQSSISLESSHKVQDAIGRALEAHYTALVREPIPDRLLSLLAKLEAGELSHE